MSVNKLPRDDHREKEKHRVAPNIACAEDKMEGLQICPFSVRIMSVRNTSENMSNEWNEMNYTEELRRTINFVLAHGAISPKIDQIQEKKYLK